MTTETTETVNNMFKQTTEGFKSAMNAGVKMQEEWNRLCSEPFAGFKSFEELRRRGKQFTTDVFGMLQKNAAETQKAFDAHCKTGIDLTHKALETVAADKTDDTCDRTVDMWQTACDAFRQSTEISMNTGVRMFENWTAFMTRAMNGAECSKSQSTAR